MAWAFLISNNAKLSRIDSFDESLKAMVDDQLGAFAKIFQWLPDVTKVHAIIQTEEGITGARKVSLRQIASKPS